MQQVTEKQALQLVASNLRRLREDRGLSMSKLAAMSGTYPSNIKRIEDAENQPNVGLLARIASALAVPMTEFFSGERKLSQAS